MAMITAASHASGLIRKTIQPSLKSSYLFPALSGERVPHPETLATVKNSPAQSYRSLASHSSNCNRDFGTVCLIIFNNTVSIPCHASRKIYCRKLSAFIAATQPKTPADRARPHRGSAADASLLPRLGFRERSTTTEGVRVHGFPTRGKARTPE